MPETLKPFTDKDWPRIEQGIQAAEDALAQIALAKQAGVDVGEREKQAQQNKARLLKIKNTYFPGR